MLVRQSARMSATSTSRKVWKQLGVTMQSIKLKDIMVLKRRREFLLNRIKSSNSDLSYDKEEAAALGRIISFLDGYTQARK